MSDAMESKQIQIWPPCEHHSCDGFECVLYPNDADLWDNENSDNHEEEPHE